MRLWLLAARNLARNKLRTLLTLAGVATAVLAFVLLRTVVTAWTAGADHAAQDRIATRHKVTFVMQLPKRYIEEIRAVPGVTRATWCNWFGARHPKRDREFFATIAVDPLSFLEVYDEIEVGAREREEWLADRRGALVGDVLARRFGWKVGDKVTLMGSIYPGDWEFTVRGIYGAKRRSVDRSTFWFHWDYMNETLTGRRRDLIGWVVGRIADPARSAEVAQAIDRRFEERDRQTLSMSERQLQTSFLGMLSTILTAIDVVSAVILGIMMLILGNTIAMGVRERMREYGILKAIGFSPRQIAGYVVAEGVGIGAAGAALGLALAWPFVHRGVGRFLEENMGGLFPYFTIAPATAALALAMAVLLGGLASALPALRAARLDPADSMRRL